MINGSEHRHSTFQAAMNDLLYMHAFVFANLSLCILTTFLSILQILSNYQFYAKFGKWSSGVSKVDYLGHIISMEGVSADPSKIQAIQDWSASTTISFLRGFMGLTGYYRRFVRDFAKRAGPLISLLRKNKFVWSSEAKTAFQLFKTTMISVPVLAIPDFDSTFEVTTDASATAIGAVLAQHHHPIAYFSKKLCSRMQLASAYDREMFAITAVVKKWRHYLLGCHFLIFTD